MNDSQKFVEALHHISWKEGLAQDILKGVQSFLSASNGGDVVDSDLGTAAPGASASTYHSSPGRASVTLGTVYVISGSLIEDNFAKLFSSFRLGGEPCCSVGSNAMARNHLKYNLENSSMTVPN